MFENIICFQCGQDGHIRADCPNRPRTRRRWFPPVPAPDAPAPERTLPRPPADAHLQAHQIRAALGWAEPDDDSPLVDSPFRHQFKILPKTEKQLRDLARQQATEARGIWP